MCAMFEKKSQKSMIREKILKPGKC